MEREPTLIYSPLDGHFTKDGITVEVLIISSDLDQAWSLEVINDIGTSTVWDNQFETDHQAYAAFRRVVEEEGMGAFHGTSPPEASNVFPFRRPSNRYKLKL